MDARELDPRATITEARFAIAATVGVLVRIAEREPSPGPLLRAVESFETGLLWLREAAESSEDDRPQTP